MKRTKTNKLKDWAHRNRENLIVAGFYATIVACIGGPIVYAIKSENDRKRETDKVWNGGFDVRDLGEGWVQIKPASKG